MKVTKILGLESKYRLAQRFFVLKIYKLDQLMIGIRGQKNTIRCIVALALFLVLPSHYLYSQELKFVHSGNFGLPGIIDLPTAKRFPDGELIMTHQNHKYLFMNGVSFQALPRIGLSFRYGGQGRGGGFAQGRVNWDRSFDAHINILDEKNSFQEFPLDFVILLAQAGIHLNIYVGTKSLGKVELTGGLGFGRLAGRETFSNSLGALSSRLKKRDINEVGRGGTLGTINWFHGDAAAFFGIRYQLSKKISIASEYTSDLMIPESRYLDVKGPWSYGISYQLNDYMALRQSIFMEVKFRSQLK